MGWFKRKSKKVPYIPQGRVGYFYKNDWPFHYSIIVEEIGRINERSKVKILEIDTHRDCSKSDSQILRDYSRGEWIITRQFTWESEEDKARRLIGLPRPYMVEEDEINEDIQYRYREDNNRTLTPHNFITENED